MSTVVSTSLTKLNLVENMDKKRKCTPQSSSHSTKRIKHETQWKFQENKFQKLIFQIGYQCAQQTIVDSYLRQTYISYVNQLIKNVIYSYYCQVNLYI